MNKIFKITLVAAVAAVAGYGVYANQKTEGVSDLVLDDVEAIAACEVSASGPKSNGECQSTNTVNCKDLSGCQ